MVLRNFSTLGSGFYNDRDREQARLRQERIRMEQAPQVAAGTPVVGRFGLPKAQVGGGGPTMPTMERMTAPQSAMTQLGQSPIYGQAGPAGQRRMEEMLRRGLPYNTDPNRVFRTGETALGTTTYGVKRESGFGGGYGQVGLPQQSTGKLQAGAPLGSAGSSGYDLAERMRQDRNGGPQPMAETPKITQRPMGETGSPFGFTPFAERMRQEEESRKSGLSGGMASLTGFGGIPRFPFSNY